jgi:predicted RNA-binding protein YlxR (DUF448 family)
VTSAAKSVPERTCVGCRQRAAANELLRVVVAPAVSRTSAESADVLVVPDPRRRAVGRGAWVHRDPICVEKAVKRRAFVRALRIPVGQRVDPDAVVGYVAEMASTDRTSSRSSIATTESQ